MRRRIIAAIIATFALLGLGATASASGAASASAPATHLYG